LQVDDYSMVNFVPLDVRKEDRLTFSPFFVTLDWVRMTDWIFYHFVSLLCMQDSYVLTLKWSRVFRELQALDLGYKCLRRVCETSHRSSWFTILLRSYWFRNLSFTILQHPVPLVLHWQLHPIWRRFGT